MSPHPHIHTQTHTLLSLTYVLTSDCVSLFVRAKGEGINGFETGGAVMAEKKQQKDRKGL